MKGTHIFMSCNNPFALKVTEIKSTITNYYAEIETTFKTYNFDLANALATNPKILEDAVNMYINEADKLFYKLPIMYNRFKHSNMECDCSGFYKMAMHAPKEESDTICLDIDRVIFNDPATIIFWKSYHIETVTDEDGNEHKHYVQDKTVVKCAKDDKFNKYHGFCAAVAKRIFDNNSTISRIVKEAQDDSKKTASKIKTDKDKKKGSKK